MSEVLRRCLEDLAGRIDERAEEENLAAWAAFLRGECAEEVFVPPARPPAPPKVPWPAVSVNAAIADAEAMLLQQFGMCSRNLADGFNGRLCVRCNYGTGILPMLFGCELFMMDEELETLPTARPLGSRDRAAALLEAGVPPLGGGLSGRVFETAERFLQALADYPPLARHVALYHPDTQGPIDIVEVVWGSEMFYAVHDEPLLLRDLLALVTDTYAAFMRKWLALVPPAGEYSAHWGLLHAGTLMIRNDSLMNLSPRTYVDLVQPMDQRLFDEFGGGAIHFCGRGDHFIEAMSRTRGLTAINLSQPELNDMETVYRHTVDKGIRLLNLARPAVDAALAARRPLRGQVHCGRLGAASCTSTRRA